MLLAVRRDDNELVFWLTTDLPAGEPERTLRFGFVYRPGEPWVAELLRRHIRDALNAEMREIRRKAYSQGWADAKAKRRKETWFSGQLP